MNDEQLDQLLSELSKTRESFDSVVKTIRWTRINTIVQYALLAVVLIMGSLGVAYYLDDKRENCERGNEFRASIDNTMTANAAAIGAALVTVTGASHEDFLEYMEAYNHQPRPEILKPRSC
jgi:hypothetical protein